MIKNINKSASYLQKCNCMGIELLNSSSGTITNAYSSVSTKIDPLMDRKLIATVSQMKPFSLEMHRWQRCQIKRYCSILNNIETDQGYTCSLNQEMVTKELLQKYMKDLMRVSHKLLYRFHLSHNPGIKQLWENEYVEARNSIEWKRALTVCKELGIIKRKVNEDTIPLELTGRIIQIGLLFSKM